MKFVYHPLSCVINKQFNILLNGMTTVWIWDWQSFGLSCPLPPKHVECFCHNSSSKLCQRNQLLANAIHNPRLVVFRRSFLKLASTSKNFLLSNRPTLKENCSSTLFWVGEFLQRFIDESYCLSWIMKIVEMVKSYIFNFKCVNCSFPLS